MTHASRAPMTTRKRGYALIEVCIAGALLAIALSVGLRLVFLTDKAIGQEERAGVQAAGALALAAQLRDDLQVATAVALPGQSVAIRLTLPDGAAVRYERTERGAMRREGAQETLFPGLGLHLSRTEDRVIEGRITSAEGSELSLVVHTRNQ